MRRGGRRVLMTADTASSVFTFAIDLCRGLVARGAEVTLATMGYEPSVDHWAAVASVPGLEVAVSRFRLEWMEDPWDDVQRAGEWLLDLDAGIQPDIVHMNGYAHGALPFSCPVVVVGHSCVLSWWSAVRREPAPAWLNRYRIEVSRGLHSARRVVAPTSAMLDSLSSNYGMLHAAAVIPSGRSTLGFARGLKEPLVLAAGRLWDEAKNIAALARVAPRLPWPVAVAGDSENPNAAGRVELDGVTQLGRLAPRDLQGWLSRSSIYALPARYEPFGLGVLEAALCECALVLGDIPSLREVWGEAAVYVHPDDEAGLEAAILALIKDPRRRRALGALARARAEAYTVDKMTAAYTSLYEQIAS